MKLQIVPPQEAKELKELGFDVKVTDFYKPDNIGMLFSGGFEHNHNGAGDNRVSAPNIHIAFLWLDTKGIHCGVFASGVRDLAGRANWKATLNVDIELSNKNLESRQDAELAALKLGIAELKRRKDDTPQSSETT